MFTLNDVKKYLEENKFEAKNTTNEIVAKNIFEDASDANADGDNFNTVSAFIFANGGIDNFDYD